MIKKLLYSIGILTILTVASVLLSPWTADTSGPGDEPPPDDIPMLEGTAEPEPGLYLCALGIQTRCESGRCILS